MTREPLTVLRAGATAGTRLACRLLGRRAVVRLSRFVLWQARLDGRNDPSINGEFALQRWAVDIAPASREIHVVDVGANVGQWSEHMLTAVRDAGRLHQLDLHAFEPSSYTFKKLSSALDGHHVMLNQLAMSDEPGCATLYVVAPGAGTNSLHKQAESCATETVRVTTLDAYAAQTGLECITFLKIDAEGHDFSILRGARSLFSGHRIALAQFEYNHRWILARTFLRDAFEYLESFGYRLGKVAKHGVEFYPGWDADLETFAEGNYVACLPAVAERLPAVAWWKPVAARGERGRCESAS